jgi:serine/threonine protein kinase
MPSHHSQKRPRGVASGSWDLDAAAPAVDTGDLGAALETEAQAVGLSLGTPRDFDRKFEMCDVIGRGAFSVVSRVVERASGRRLAVKTLDARPLRLRPNFSPKRLLREACILSRLRHPNIVAYVGVWAGGDNLRLVMEEAAGRELFDVILEKQAIDETRAKPILRQLAGALAYLHEHKIAHRDVKPENVLVSAESPPRVTLIDFGLSKALLEDNEDEGAFPLLATSVGKTFVGTPCYLAPEIEAIHQGGVGAPSSYGVAVDAWSLGAVVNVTLVARFPEFERSSAKSRVKVDTAAFTGVSQEARDLIGRLMVPDPSERLTTRDALNHPWLRDELERPATPLQFDEGLHLVPRESGEKAWNPATFRVDDLLGLQQTIAVCLRSAFATYQDVPGVSRALRRSAVLCRSQLLENAKLLRKIEHTASSVLDIHDDLELAVDAGQSALARELVATVKGWVGGLKEAVKNVQVGNAQQMHHLHAAISEVESACKNGEELGNTAIDGYDSDGTKDGSPTLPLKRDGSSASLKEIHERTENMALGGVEDALKAATAAAGAIASCRREGAVPSPPKLTGALTPKFFPDTPAPERVFELALRQLERMDAVLERLALLWDSTEVVFDTLLQKSEHIEKFLEFAREPQLLVRFRQRLAEYKQFWVDVQSVSRATLQESPRNSPPVTF